ncbi:NAD(P)/FAD-dependent oxidoreductase [Aliiroseovarius sp. PTFE2010]|uniref:NAD(P)/FAD-dependent oxidoreductase n=1 Tax=Aliiroseovarius sp. PTFE2010 TaxID=3417190 RepID=UPI003CF1FE11
MTIVQVTVRGAGAIGLSIAWELVQRGADVRVIDPRGGGGGASGGVVGALAPHTPDAWNAKKQFQFDSLIAANAFWRAVEAAGGVSPGYARIGRLQPIADDRAEALARQRQDAAGENWQGKAQWRVCPARDFGGWAPPSATGLVVHDTLSARLHPAQACAALMAALRAKGVRIEIEGKDAGPVIHATGYEGLQELTEVLAKPVGNGVKGQAALLAHDAGAVPQIYAENIHFIPHADGTLAIGSTSERDFAHPTETDAKLDDLIARAQAVMPRLAGAAVIRRWAGVRPRASSRAPLLGAWPGRESHFIANGGFKIGFGIAPGVARAMADLVLDGHDTIPPAFTPAALM